MARVKKLYRCTVAHWQGDTFIKEGTILPEGHPQIILDFFEVEEHEVTG